MTRNSWFDHRVPPPVVAAICLLVMWSLARRWPQASFEFAGQTPLAALLVIAGLAVEAAAVIGFRRQRTTVNPLHPDRATALVAGGIYRVTRNPMYLGMAIILLGGVVYIGNIAALAGLAAFIAWIDRFQILPEERALAGKFGAEFAEYRRRVRRWI